MTVIIGLIPDSGERPTYSMNKKWLNDQKQSSPNFFRDLILIVPNREKDFLKWESDNYMTAHPLSPKGGTWIESTLITCNHFVSR
jgi:hypothetical protein